ncbi:hypothetical protein [Streptomyces sp. NBC_01353]|uniref:hypothetical protein n=1 Tax=Streptomyces sp. NBC_01353 TaxID=2903835 RepID=UPI002E37C220|nr:hypothetical protein [Streptomyces sp. NBC_01353]
MTREPDPLAAALSAALRGEQGGADAGEARAREAFRAARDTEGYAARRTRRRDDWRSVPVRGRWCGSLRTTAFGVAATVLLGGVAVAASGTLDPAPPAPAPAPAREKSGASHSASASPVAVGEVRNRPQGSGADQGRGMSDGTVKGEGVRKSKGNGATKGKAKSVDQEVDRPQTKGQKP